MNTSMPDHSIWHYLGVHQIGSGPVCCEPSRVIVICSKAASPLTRLAQEYQSVDVVTLKLPFGKDGFLATNSLLAFSVILVRAYAAAYSINNSLPTEIETLVHPDRTRDEFIGALRNQCQPLWDRENLAVLYGPQTHAAAFDVESKFIEAALGAVQISDYRNFAHGRHHWLAKRGDTTGVLGFVTEEDADISEKTLRLLPPHVPAVRLSIPGEGVVAGLAAMVCTLHMVGLAGVARGIDPGRPGVPDFGRKIYNLRTYAKRNGTDPYSGRTASIERKTGTGINKLRELGDLQFGLVRCKTPCSSVMSGTGGRHRDEVKRRCHGYLTPLSFAPRTGLSSTRHYSCTSIALSFSTC